MCIRQLPPRLRVCGLLSFLCFVVPLTVLLSPPRVQAEAQDVFVLADNVSLRTGPGELNEAAGQVNKGDRLTSQGITEGDWLAVDPPLHIGVYVYRELVADNRVLVAKLHVRGGPGIAYKPVGSLERGDRIVVRREVGEWLEIEPPIGSRLWLHRNFASANPPGYNDDSVAADEVAPNPVSVVGDVTPGGVGGIEIPTVVQPVRVEESASRATPVQESVAVAAPVAVAVPQAMAAPVVESEAPAVVLQAPDRPVAAPPVAMAEAPGRPVASRSVLSAPTGELLSSEVTFVGILRPAGFGIRQRSTRYRVVTVPPSGRAITACYLLVDESEVMGKIGRKVRVTGRPVVMQGVKQPVVRAGQVVVVDP